MGCVGFSLICSTRSMKYNVLQDESPLSNKAIAYPFHSYFFKLIITINMFGFRRVKRLLLRAERAFCSVFAPHSLSALGSRLSVEIDVTDMLQIILLISHFICILGFFLSRRITKYNKNSNESNDSLSNL